MRLYAHTTQWEFYRGHDFLWHWRSKRDSGNTDKDSSSGFRYLLECYRDAARHGDLLALRPGAPMTRSDDRG